MFCFSQSVDSDTLLVLPIVEVKEQIRSDNKEHLNKEELSVYQGHSAADVLQSEGFSFVKSYGSGSIATASVRGGSAGQMAVFWNGLPIQSPMLGLVDLSILNMGGIDELEFKKGGQSTALGSGAMSGALILSQKTPDEGFQVGLTSSIGSFAQQRQLLNLSIGSEKWKMRTVLHKNSAENNFPYQIRANLPIVKQAHANTTQKGIDQSVFWQIHPQHRLQFNYWFQESDRNIPPTTVQTRSEARQEDAFHRTMIKYVGQSKKTVFDLQLGYFKERILYEDPQILLSAPTSFESLIVQSSYTTILGASWQAKGGLQLVKTDAIAEEYGATRTQTYLAIHQTFSKELSQRSTIKLGSRLTAIKNIERAVAAYHIEYKNELYPNAQLLLRVSRDFHIPTLNDLYWIPGGKPDLETEFALGQEIGFNHQNNKKKRFHWSYKVNVFNRNVNNWIQWTQKANTSFWSVDNITKVWSRGVEQSVKGVVKIGQLKLSSQFKIDWIKSTYQTAIENPSIEKGESLWYTPEWRALAKLKIETTKWATTYSHHWTSTTYGINDNLAAYNLGQIELKYKYSTTQNSAKLFIRLANIWDAQYRIIENRPMPGQNFEIGIQLQQF